MVGRLNKGAKRYSSNKRKRLYFDIKEIKFKQIFNRAKYFSKIARRAYFIGRRLYRRKIKILRNYMFFSKKKIKKLNNKFVKKKKLNLKFYILKTDWLFNYSKLRNISILKKNQIYKYRSYLGKNNLVILEDIFKRNKSSKYTLEYMKYINKKVFFKLRLLRKYIIKNSSLRKRRNYDRSFGTAFALKLKKNLYKFDHRNVFVFARFLRFSFKFLKKVTLTTIDKIKERKKRIDIYKEYLKENKIVSNQYFSYKDNINKLFLCCLAYEENL